MIEATAQQIIYEWLENELWEYLPDSALQEIDDEDMPVVQQYYAQMMGWA